LHRVGEVMAWKCSYCNYNNEGSSPFCAATSKNPDQAACGKWRLGGVTIAELLKELEEIPDGVTIAVCQSTF
jgi:hypothetical protein